MEGKCEEVNELETASSDSFIDDMDNDEPSSSGQDDGVNLETPLTEEEIEELISELLEVESKAAEAQESLEDEALSKIEIDVREELAQSYNGDELEKAVMDEMETLKEEWEAVLDEIETECAHLLEQLDGAGIELPSLYKWIESQAPNGCSTEAWKKRAHWVGSQVTNDVTVSLADTEKYLQTHRPVRNKLGKVLEEGASGFLGKKLAIDGKEALIETSDLDWSSLNGIFSSSADSTSFGSNHWAYVYLASTPQQAAQLGIKFPGVDEVEEIDDLEGSSDFPDAIVNEEESNLSEEQKKNFRKVKEEDDVDIDRKLQLLLKRRRQRNRCKQEALQKDVSSVDRLVEGNIDDSETLNSVLVENPVGPNDYKIDITRDSSQIGSDSSLPSLIDARGFKRLHDSDEVGSDYKKTRVVTIDSDDETVVTKDESCLTLDGACDRVDHQDLQGIENGRFPACNLSQSVEEVFHCTACHKVATEVHPHPLLDVIICGECKSLIESKTHVKDPECSECYCGWCGRNSDLISCRSCKKLFCTICIRSNLGEKCLFEVQASGWKCCCCTPSILQRLTLQFERAIISRDLMVSSSDSDEDDNVVISTRKDKRKEFAGSLTILN